MKKKTKTLAERVGEKNLPRFLELLYHEKSFTEIAKAMPQVFKSKNAVAGCRHKYRREIDTELTALRVIYGPPSEKGRSHPFAPKKLGPKLEPETMEGKLAQLAQLRASPASYAEPEDLGRDPKAHLKHRIASALIEGEWWDGIAVRANLSVREVTELVRHQGGIAEFLMRMGYIPKLAKLVQELHTKRKGR